MFKSKNRKQVYDRWLLQKRSICVIYCHIGKVQKGNKKPRSLDEKTGFKRAGPKGLEPSTSGLTEQSGLCRQIGGQIRYLNGS